MWPARQSQACHWTHGVVNGGSRFAGPPALTHEMLVAPAEQVWDDPIFRSHRD
jgi:hypothetical protein